MPTRRPSLGAIFLTVFLDLLGFGLVFPFLAEEARDSFGTSALVGTLLAAVYSLMQFLFVPVWGRLSDRVGRRPVLVWSVAATALSMSGLGLALAWGQSVVFLFLARTFAGIATANLGTASAYIADITPPAERARGMGLIGMAFGLGFIFGPAVGGLLAEVPIGGRHGPLACFVAAGLSVVNLTWVAFGLPESLSEEQRQRARERPRSLMPLDLQAVRAAFDLPGVAVAIAINFVVVLSFTNLDQTFRYLHKDVFALSQRETGALLAFVGVVAALVQGVAIRPLSRRFSERLLIAVGVAFQACAFFGIAVAPSVAPLVVASALLAIGNGLTQPSLSAFVSKRADASSQGSTLGVSQAAASLARAGGPAIGGFFYGAVGPRAPYVAATLGLVFALALTRQLDGRGGTDGQRG